jgi:hypothetical protein
MTEFEKLKAAIDVAEAAYGAAIDSARNTYIAARDSTHAAARAYIKYQNETDT